MRPFAILLVAGALLLTACNGGDDAAVTATPGPGASGGVVPTATPFAQIPEPIIVTGSTPAGGSGSSEDAVEYVVEAGDTIGLIAERFGVSADVIREANEIDGDNIFVGQTLTIPRGDGSNTSGGVTDPSPTRTPPPDGLESYTVVAGDTAYGIALQFDVTVEQLEEANGVGPGGLDALQEGQVLVIPRP